MQSFQTRYFIATHGHQNIGHTVRGILRSTITDSVMAGYNRTGARGMKKMPQTFEKCIFGELTISVWTFIVLSSASEGTPELHINGSTCMVAHYQFAAIPSSNVLSVFATIILTNSTKYSIHCSTYYKEREICCPHGLYFSLQLRSKLCRKRIQSKYIEATQKFHQQWSKKQGNRSRSSYQMQHPDSKTINTLNINFKDVACFFCPLDIGLFCIIYAQ